MWGGAEGRGVWLDASRCFENASLKTFSEFCKFCTDVSGLWKSRILMFIKGKSVAIAVLRPAPGILHESSALCSDTLLSPH